MTVDCWVCRLQAMCFLLYMAQSSVLINNKDLIPPNLWFGMFIYIICYSNIYKVSDLFIVGDLVVLSLSNTQIPSLRFLDKVKLAHNPDGSDTPSVRL